LIVRVPAPPPFLVVGLASRFMGLGTGESIGAVVVGDDVSWCLAISALAAATMMSELSKAKNCFMRIVFLAGVKFAFPGIAASKIARQPDEKKALRGRRRVKRPDDGHVPMSIGRRPYTTPFPVEGHPKQNPAVGRKIRSLVGKKAWWCLTWLQEAPLPQIIRRTRRWCLPISCEDEISLFSGNWRDRTFCLFFCWL
jgi:hypothetical protein